jgi:hypothetical protein
VTLAQSFTGTSGSWTNPGNWGRAEACTNGIGNPALPQNTFSTEQGNGACAALGYGMDGRATAELLHQLNGFLFAATGLPAYKAQGDDLFSAAYGCGTSTKGCLSGGTGLATNITGGGPGADGGAGNFADLLVYQVDSQFARGKEFGSNAGAGLADTYLAYRLGGRPTRIFRPLSLNFDLTSRPDATKVRVTVVQPSGTATQVVCQASPCEVSVDSGQGDHLVQLDYLSATDAVVAAGQQQILKVP